MVCNACGSILVSDGVNWTCSRLQYDADSHSKKNPPTVIKDKRVTLKSLTVSSNV